MKWRTPAAVVLVAALAILAPDIAARCVGLPAAALDVLRLDGQPLKP